jgi:hypothetical protein
MGAATASRLLTVLFITAVLGGCERAPQPVPLTSPAAKTTTSQPTSSEFANMRDFVKDGAGAKADAMPPGHPPVSGTLPPAVMPGAASEGPAVMLKYVAPESWVREPVKSGMRADQYRLPRAASDTEDGELAVFSMGVGGDVQSNVDRWRGQFSTADGNPIPDADFAREALTVGDLKITFVDIRGRYSGAAMGAPMGAAPTPSKDNYRMLAAIVETASNPWFFKATGPDATMAQQRDAFRAFLQTMAIAN